MKGDKSEDVPRLELHEANEHPSAPPGVLAQVVQQGEGVGGEVKESEEEHGDEDQSDGGSVEEQHTEYQVVSRVLRQEQTCSSNIVTRLPLTTRGDSELTEELSIELDLGQSLVEPECRGGGAGHQSLVVAVVRVPQDGQDVAHSEDHRGNPR